MPMPIHGRERAVYTMKKTIAAGLALASVLSVSARTVTALHGYGWTCDGHEVEVPHCWNVRDAADGATTFLPAGGDTYQRARFVYARDLPDPTKGKRQFVRFEGASQKAEVWVNGKLVGTHVGAFGAFAFEITSAMKAKGNRLEVAVDNRYDPDVPPADRCDFPLFGGLYRNVWLVETDAACIDPAYYGGPGVRVSADATGRLEADVRLRGTGPNARLAYRVFDAEDRQVAATQSPSARCVLNIETPRLWTPETPALYRLEVTLEDGASEDVVTVPFGFRTVAFKADGFYLNGVRRKLRGVCRHQDREERGWAIWKEDAPADVDLIKTMGADALRTAHYPNAGQVYDLCDEKGLLAWCELPLVGGVTPSATYSMHAKEMQREMVEQLGNHPSIFAWSVFNEITQDKMNVPEAAVGLVRDVDGCFRADDPTRPTVAATNTRETARENAVTEALALNVYPGWYGGRVEDFGATIKAYLAATGRTTLGVSEYGAGAGAGSHGHPEMPVRAGGRHHPEEYQAWYHRAAYRAIAAEDAVWGSFVWNMFDFASDSRHEGERDGINDKGLVTYDRRTLKDAFFFYKANWNPSPMLHLVGKRMRETEVNRMTVVGFCNVTTSASHRAEVVLTVNGRRVGAQTPDEVNSVVWKDVPLSEGPNVVELKCGTLREVAVWDVKAAPHPLETLPPHPRVLATAADFARLRESLRTSPRARAGFGKIRFEADAMMDFPKPVFQKEGRRMLSVSQRTLHRVLAWAMVYRLSDERKYARRAIEEMLAVAAFPNWNPAHFLDVAEMDLAVAIGYDWLQEEMSPAEKATLAEALHYKGLCDGSGQLHGGWWASCGSNWGQVCHAGMLAAAAALAEDVPEVARQVVKRAVENLPKPMKAFSPEGGFPEGPGFYWGYAMIYNGIAIDLLKSLCGTDYGLSALPGFAVQADYMDAMTGPSGYKFNYADAGIDPDQQKLARRAADPAVWWLAHFFARPDTLVRFELPLFDAWAADRTPPEAEARRSFARHTPLMLLWLEEPPASTEPTAALNRVLGGEVPVVVQRSSWDPRAWYVGLKAGSPQGPHGHMDAGSFVLDAKGVRWAIDLGSEDYNKQESKGQDFWSGAQNSPRWEVFRLGAASHNLPILNGQKPLAVGRATVSAFRSAAPSVATVDLSSCYDPSVATRVVRSGEMLDGGYRLTDEVTARRVRTYRWQMLTPASVGKMEGNVLVLEQGGERLTLTAPAGAKWQAKDVSEPLTPHESPNPGVTQVFFEMRLPKDGKVVVAFQ